MHLTSDRRSNLSLQGDSQLFPKLVPGSVDAAANRSDGDAHDLGDFFVAKAFHLLQNERGTILLGQFREGIANDPLGF